MEVLIKIFPSLIQGAAVTLQVFLVTLACSLPLACLLSALQQMTGKLGSAIFQLYITIERGTPLLLQLMFIFFGLPYLGITLSREVSIFVAFILNYTAYFIEIFRGAIASIDKGQQEAGLVLGFSRSVLFFRILLPQAIRNAIPSVGNEVLNLVKDTSLIYVLGASELLKVGRGAVNTYATALPFVAVGLIYLAMCAILTVGMRWLENKMNYY